MKGGKLMKPFFVAILVFGISVSLTHAAECWKVESTKGEINLAEGLSEVTKDGKNKIVCYINGAWTEIEISNIHSLKITGKENRNVTGTLKLKSGSTGSFKKDMGSKLVFKTEFGSSYISLYDLKYLGPCDEPSERKQTTTSSRKADSVLMKNGDILSGSILTQKFKFQSSYAKLTVKSEDIRRIDLEGGGQNIEIIHLRSGDRISGILANEKLEIKLPIGSSVTLEKDKIKIITFKE